MKQNDIRISLLILVFFSVTAFLIPLTFGDDLDWAGKGGTERLSVWFENYNGRYLGNLIVLLITRHTIIRIIIYAFINTGLIFLIYKLSGSRKISTYLVITILLLGMPALVYGQTFGWFSGFVNYNIGMFFSLLSIYLLMNKNHFLLIFTTAICGQLFLENIALFNIFSAICLFFLVREKIDMKIRLSYLIGAVIGAFIMFSNSGYDEIINGNDSYRSINTDSILELLLVKFTPYILFHNIILILFLSGSLIAICIKSKTFRYPCIYICAFTVFAIVTKFYAFELTNIHITLSVVIFLSSIAYLLSVVFIIHKHAWFTQNKRMILYWLLSAIVILLPFLAITPFGPRGEFTSYVIMVIVISGIWNTGINHFKSRKAMLYLKFSAVLISAFILFIHSFNLYVFHDRMNHIQYLNDGKTMVISEVPFPDYGHNLSPEMRWITSPRMFREYYNISNDIEIRFIPYEFCMSSLLKSWHHK